MQPISARVGRFCKNDPGYKSVGTDFATFKTFSRARLECSLKSGDGTSEAAIAFPYLLGVTEVRLNASSDDSLFYATFTNIE